MMLKLSSALKNTFFENYNLGLRNTVEPRLTELWSTETVAKLIKIAKLMLLL